MISLSVDEIIVKCLVASPNHFLIIELLEGNGRESIGFGHKSLFVTNNVRIKYREEELK